MGTTKISKSGSSLTLSLVQLLIIYASSGSRSQFAKYDQEPQPVPLTLSEERCTFPSRWSGNWFQSGVPLLVSINQTWINSKGHCIEADGDKFIVYSQSEECYRCVVFHEKHLNVLQYKETFCYNDLRDLSLQRLCRRIPGDAHLYSMFRLDSVPIECPFEGSFTFTYSRGKGVCQSPVSTIDTCIRTSQLVLHYQACYDVPGTESRVEELECVAGWKEGSTRYMVGLLQNHHDPFSYEDRFRCFAYEANYKMRSPSLAQRYTNHRASNQPSWNHSQTRFLQDSKSSNQVIFRVAQSGDATCLGLSPVEGARTLALKRAVPVERPCHFPNWLQAHVQWLTLDGSLAYAFSDSSLHITQTSNESDKNPLLTSAVCAKEPGSPHLERDRETFILRSTTACKIGYTCLQVNRKDTHIMELRMGNLVRDQTTACHSFNFDESLDPVTLISPSPETRECPYTGQFDIMDITGIDSRKCRQEFKGSLLMGCSGLLDSMHMNMYCPMTEEVHVEYTCNGWWEDSTGDIYLIATSSKKEHFCFRIEEQILELSPQELKRKRMRFADYDSSGESQKRSQKLFNFYQYTSTCHKRLTPRLRLLNPTSLAFNTSNFGICSVESDGHQNSLLNTYPRLMILSFLILLVHFN